MRNKALAGLATCFLTSGALCQVAAEGSPVEVSEFTFNAAGHPVGGVVPTSAEFRITMDALGDGVAGNEMSSSSYRVTGGLPNAFPPPGAVENVRFPAHADLSWDPEPSAGQYAVYRGDIADLSLPGPFGDCFVAPVTATSAIDTTEPSSGEGFFYLVTVANRLGEEGTKNVDGAAGPVERPFVCSDSCFCNPATCAGGCN